MLLAHRIADAEMDSRLDFYATKANRNRDRAAIEDAKRAQGIRDHPKFAALVDLVAVDGVTLVDLRGRQPERVRAVAELLDTGAILLEPDTTRKAVLMAARKAVREILDALNIPPAELLDVTRQILDMARDWASQRMAARRALLA